MEEFGVFLFFICGFIGCFVILPLWLGGTIKIKNKKDKLEELKKLQKETFEMMVVYNNHMNQLESSLCRRVGDVQNLIKEMQVPLEKYVYENLIKYNLKDFIKDNIQEKFEDIERKLKYQLEQDMYEIKHQVNEVVAHFEKDDRQRLIEYVEKSFETDGKQILLERLKNKQEIKMEIKLKLDLEKIKELLKK